MTISKEDLEAFRQVLREELGAVSAGGTDRDDPIGPLNDWGAHKIAGQPEDMWFFTLTGWDRATTVQQRANLASQLGIDGDTGELVGTGAGVTAFSEGRDINTTYISLWQDIGRDTFGNIRWQKYDDRGHWAFNRVRIRARGIEAIRAVIASVPPFKPSGQKQP